MDMSGELAPSSVLSSRGRLVGLHPLTSSPCNPSRPQSSSARPARTPATASARSAPTGPARCGRCVTSNSNQVPSAHTKHPQAGMLICCSGGRRPTLARSSWKRSSQSAGTSTRRPGTRPSRRWSRCSARAPSRPRRECSGRFRPPSPAQCSSEPPPPPVNDPPCSHEPLPFCSFRSILDD